MERLLLEIEEKELSPFDIAQIIHEKGITATEPFYVEFSTFECVVLGDLAIDKSTARALFGLLHKVSGGEYTYRVTFLLTERRLEVSP